MKLSSDFTNVTELVSEFRSGDEAPVMFKHDGKYYVLIGSDCCYCTGGSNTIVMMATTLRGPWISLGIDSTALPAPLPVLD